MVNGHTALVLTEDGVSPRRSGLDWLETVTRVVNSTGDPAFATGDDQAILVWNGAASKLFGYRQDEVAARNCWEIVRGKAEDGTLICTRSCVAACSLKQRKPVPGMELWATDKNEISFCLNVTHFAIQGPRTATLKRQLAIVHIVHDITPYHWARQTMQRVVETFREFGMEVTGVRKDPVAATNGGVGSLSQREREVLRLIASGSSTDQVATLLDIKQVTVRNYVQKILSKLDASTRLAAVMEARRRGWI